MKILIYSNMHCDSFLLNSCYGQTLTVSTYIGETLYAIFLAVLGLVLFAHLIGNVQVLSWCKLHLQIVKML